MVNIILVVYLCLRDRIILNVSHWNCLSSVTLISTSEGAIMLSNRPSRPSKTSTIQNDNFSNEIDNVFLTGAVKRFTYLGFVMFKILFTCGGD